MSPYVFRHYNEHREPRTPRYYHGETEPRRARYYHGDTEPRRVRYYNEDTEPRRARYYDETRNPRRYDFHYDYDYRIKPRQKSKNRHHHHHHYYLDSPGPRRPQMDRTDDHRIHYISPPARSLPVMEYVPSTPGASPRRRDNVGQLEVLKARAQEMSSPRIMAHEKRRHWDRDSMICFDSCPRKSSNMIPTMHYDQLRCPHCWAHIQPPQGEVQAYPWSTVSHRKSRHSGPHSDPGVHTHDKYPKGPTAAVNGAPTNPAVGGAPTNPAASEFSTQRLQGNAAPLRKPPTPDHPNHPVPLKAQSKADYKAPKEDIRLAVRSRPMFGSGEKARNPRGTYLVKEPRSIVPPRELHEDDIQPNDSVSNVGAPAVRAETDLSLPGGYRPSHKLKRGASGVDHNYHRDHYFRSVREQHPVYAPSTPGPGGVARGQPQNRVYQGHYYDRRNDRTYKYNIDMGKRSVVSDRRPYG